jgi:hypothetical protein
MHYQTAQEEDRHLHDHKNNPPALEQASKLPLKRE